MQAPTNKEAKITEDLVPHQEASTSSAPNLEAFVYEGHSFPFCTMTNSYTCPFCNKPQKRLPTHIKKGCSPTLDYPSFERAFKQFSASKAKQRQRSKDEAAFLAAQNKHKAASQQRQRSKDEAAFLADQNKRKAASQQKQQSKDEAAFLADQNKRKVASRQRQRSEDEPAFLANQNKHQESSRKRQRPEDEAERRRYNTFQRSTLYGPIFPCCCCHRSLFKQSVVQLTDKIKQSIIKDAPDILKACIYKPDQTDVPDDLKVNISKGPQAWLCQTCRRYLTKDKMPPMCAKNRLTMDPLPRSLTQLTQLEATLIAQRILFMTIQRLPVSRWQSLQGRVVNIPIPPENLNKTLGSIGSMHSQLPRSPKEAGLITVELKRKLVYKKTAVQPKLIDPANMFSWISHLKQAGNPYYQEVSSGSTAYEDYEARLSLTNPKGYSSVTDNICQDDLLEDLDTPSSQTQNEINDELHPTSDEASDDEPDQPDKDPCRKHNLTYDQSVAIMTNYPEMAAKQSRVLSVAPGEGQAPENILFTKDWDIQAFPHLHNLDGKQGLHDEDRPVHITDQDYFNQRILNTNKRFSRHQPYMYAAVSLLDQKRIQSNINMSYTVGFEDETSEGKLSLVNHDAYSALQKIPNTPRFWKEKKSELLHKLNSFGPFHWFFSLSCADKRWPNLMTAIIRELPEVVQVHIAFQASASRFSEPIITVETKNQGNLPLDDFLKSLPDSQHTLIMDNVLTATRVFDQRLKAFIRNIVMGKDQPMKVLLYSYRIEFQKRGAPHAHGVLWLDMDKVEKEFPGLKKAYDKLRHQKPLGDPTSDEITSSADSADSEDSASSADSTEIENDAKPIVQMLDRFVTCSLHEETAGGKDVVDIVRACQTHHHTHTCKKRSLNGTTCRFNIPKLPSEETVLCQPYSDKKEMVKAVKALDKVRKVLEDEDTMALLQGLFPEKGDTREDYVANRQARIQALCAQAGVGYDDYKRYLKMSHSGYSVVLQRDIDEVYINAYNREWIRAWNANMDLQPVLDFFAVITYVTEYAYKPEPGDSDITKALEAVKGEDMKTQLKTVGNAYQTGRTMGEAEAYYKLVPSLTLVDSNVGVQFISLDKEEHKTKRVRRATPQNRPEETIEVKDMEGSWVKQWDLQDKYLRRPDSLDNVCMAQFARMYQSNSKPKPSDSDEQVEGDETLEDPAKQPLEATSDDPFEHFKTDRIFADGKATELPLHIELQNPHPGETKHMRRRNIPQALSYFKVKQARDPIRFFFQELMLYVPHSKPKNGTMCDHTNSLYEGNMVLGTRDLMTLSDNDIGLLYDAHQEHIRLSKQAYMPYVEDVEEQRFFVEQTQLQDIDFENTGAKVAPGKEHEPLHDPDEDLPCGEGFDHLDPSLLETPTPEGPKAYDYGKIIIPDMNDLCRRTHSLDKDQRRVVDIVIRYCQDILRSEKNGIQPSPPHMMVHGAAGTGKSTVIDLVAQWATSILQKAGDGPDQPFVLKTAFTGTAAANIGGNTLTSTFHFMFGNKHFSLTDKQRDKTKHALHKLKIVIIDEISMVKADMLYQLDLRLQEIKDQPNVPFGGVMIAAFGDIFQLKPVRAPYIFAKPQNPAYHLNHTVDNRWKMLSVINLKTNHRQGADGAFADLLNRVRVTNPGELPDKDIKTLQKRVRPTNHPDMKTASLNIVCTLKKGHAMNKAYLENMPGEETVIKARTFQSNNKAFKPNINPKDGTITGTGFMNELRLKPNTKVMLIKNIDTPDGLTNGQTGELIGMKKQTIEGPDPETRVTSLIVRFDREAVGKQARNKNPRLETSYPGGTEIKLCYHSYSLNNKGGGATATLIQFPIRLAHASTAHKIQGLTVHQPSTVSLDLSLAFEPAQAYVMLGRAQSLDQVFIMDSLNPDKLYASCEAQTEYGEMNKRAINNDTEGWYADLSNTTKVASLNIARLQPHLQDLLADPTLLKADLVHLSETWLKPDAQQESVCIPSYSSHFISVGAGKGIVTFFKEGFHHDEDIIRDDYQITSFSSETLTSIHLYRSDGGNTANLLQDLQNLQNLIQEDRATLVSGDFNICLIKAPNNMVTRFLKDCGFQQLNKEPTHRAGGQIDHVYLRDPLGLFKPPDLLRYSPYYDHDALCTSLVLQQVSHTDTDYIKLNLTLPKPSALFNLTVYPRMKLTAAPQGIRASDLLIDPAICDTHCPDCHTFF